jgi:hypothetical protein
MWSPRLHSRGFRCRHVKGRGSTGPSLTTLSKARIVLCSMIPQDAQKGCTARPQAEQEPEAYPRGTLRILVS